MRVVTAWMPMRPFGDVLEAEDNIWVERRSTAVHDREPRRFMEPSYRSSVSSS
jgi:hypothetical protein